MGASELNPFNHPRVDVNVDYQTRIKPGGFLNPSQEEYITFERFIDLTSVDDMVSVVPDLFHPAMERHRHYLKIGSNSIRYMATKIKFTTSKDTLFSIEKGL